MNWEALIIGFAAPIFAILITGLAIKFFIWILKDEEND